MKILVLGAGMMGRAIAYDLCTFSNFEQIILADNNKEALESAQSFLHGKKVDFQLLNVKDGQQVTNQFKQVDIAISAVPYRFNYELAQCAIASNTHFLDLGGNNDIVTKQRKLFSDAEKNKVTCIPDCGLAPGLVSIITRDIVEELDTIEYVKIRVGGLPLDPIPPLNYQIVFSPYGLINEYVEDAAVLDHGEIQYKQSMTDLESLHFPEPFGEMEAFLTSGGCSTLPFTYNNIIDYLDYKTIRYPGHCQQFKLLLDLGLAEEHRIRVGKTQIFSRDFLASYLLQKLPSNGKDVVLIKVLCKGMENGKHLSMEYMMIDYYDEDNTITAMMRTTAFPVSIIAQMIEQSIITKRGVFCCEEIVPPNPFFSELSKRNIIINKERKYE